MSRGRTRRRVILEESEKLDLKPGDRNLVVDVVGRVVLLENDLRVTRQAKNERRERWTNLCQSIDSLLVAHTVRLQIVLTQRHHQTCHRKRNSLQSMNELRLDKGNVHSTDQIRVVHDGDDTERPFSRGNDVGMLSVQTQQRQSSLLLDERPRGSESSSVST